MEPVGNRSSRNYNKRGTTSFHDGAPEKEGDTGSLGLQQKVAWPVAKSRLACGKLKYPNFASFS